jgi:hypothetical protein
MPKFWGSSDLRGEIGTVVEQGGHEERWVVMVGNSRVSFHRNHLAALEDPEREVTC